jgi:TPR repeat protein
MKLLIPLMFLLVSSTSAFCVTADEFKKLEESAKQGDAEAQSELGRSYANGDGVVLDFNKAVVWFKKGAEQGVAKAQSGLGACYLNGQGIEKDPKKAVLWFEKAAKQGFALGQYNLGGCYPKLIWMELRC